MKAKDFKEWATKIDVGEAALLLLASINLQKLEGASFILSGMDPALLTHLRSLKCAQCGVSYDMDIITIKTNNAYKLPHCVDNTDDTEREIDGIIADLAWQRNYYKWKAAARANLDPLVREVLEKNGYVVDYSIDGVYYIGLEEDF